MSASCRTPYNTELLGFFLRLPINYVKIERIFLRLPHHLAHKLVNIFSRVGVRESKLSNVTLVAFQA